MEINEATASRVNASIGIFFFSSSWSQIVMNKLIEPVSNRESQPWTAVSS